MESRESIDIDISRYLLMFKRQWVAAALVLATTVTLSAVATTFLKPSYEASGKLLFITPSFQLVQGENGGELKTVLSGNPINNQIELILSPAFLQQVIDKLELKNQKGKSLEVESLASALTLKIIGGTDVLRVSYASRNPEEAAEVVNTIMSLYLKNDILINSSEAEATRKILTKRLPQNEAAVNFSGLELRRFKQKNNIVDIAEETKSSVAFMGNLNNEINIVKAQIEDINAQADALRQKIGLTSQEAIIVSNLSQSPAVQEILKNLQALDIQLGTERSRFLDETPIIVNLLDKKASLNNILQNEIEKTIGSQTKVPQGLLQIGALRQSLIQTFLQLEIQRIGLAQRLASLYSTRSNYDKRAKLIPQLVQRQHDLERNLEVAESTYKTMLKKIQELELAEKKNTANGKIIARALVPQKPVSGKKMLFLVLGMLFGIFIATTIVLLIELSDKSLKTLQEVRESFRYTLLGILPLLDKKLLSRHRNAELKYPAIIVENAPHCLTSEMYRMIQANLKFLSSDKVLKTIVVTSAVPKEGKSTVSANLAAAIAQLGRRVLLIDADMRFPFQHTLWQLTNTAGLSDFLVGQVEFHKIAHPVMDNLDVLPSGVKPPNPLALLDSKRMASVIADLSSQYDFVIIDSPPFLLAADALTLGQMTDGILLVARPGVINYNSAATAQEMLERSGQHILGLVVNGMIEKNEPYQITPTFRMK